jgi:anti-sigma factor RsiW
MSCAPFDLRDFVLGELPANAGQAVEQHAAGCAACRLELERLRATETALFALREEEPPRRIAFVSDKVFEPSWWQRFWQSGPKLGFASAAMLSAAILTYTFFQPAPVAPAPVVDNAVIAERVEAELTHRLPAAVASAIADLEAQQQERLVKAVAEVEKKNEFQRRADLVAVEANFHVLRQQMNRMYVASSELGARGQ